MKRGDTKKIKVMVHWSFGIKLIYFNSAVTVNKARNLAYQEQYNLYFLGTYGAHTEHHLNPYFAAALIWVN